jgi:3',5'-cyclic-AMP phosphodiesterase
MCASCGSNAARPCTSPRSTACARARRTATSCARGCHHHITHKAAATHPPPIAFGVRPDQGGRACLDVLARHDHVRLVVHGHTHRNDVSYDPLCGARLPFLENGALKEYPGGYAPLRVHEDGIVRTFHRPTRRSPARGCARPRGRSGAARPRNTRGTLESRGFVQRFGRLPLPGPRPSLLGPL